MISSEACLRSEAGAPAGAFPVSALVKGYREVRAATLSLCDPLELEDYVVQSMPDASPAKWHLAHTTWFFEEFVLQRAGLERPFHDERFRYLFNSYYNSVGPMHSRPQRGLLSRPTVREVFEYRRRVDERVCEFLASHGDIWRDEPEARGVIGIIVLGLHHEQQHQELLLTDIKHLFACNPLLPPYRRGQAAHAVRGEHGEPASRTAQAERPAQAAFTADPSARACAAFGGGLIDIGHAGDDFCFDNELPRHRTYLRPFRLAARPVTNGEFQEFVRTGGYDNPTLWLSDGWATVQREGWRRPIYWSESLDAEFTLLGLREIDADAPVCHVSYYEADAFARWAGARLPTEFEWEAAAAKLPVDGHFVEDGHWHPQRAAAGGRGLSVPGPGAASPALVQMFGDVWEWTQSAYAAYPGYRPVSGALGEYNGKFMVNQLVLRGGSCATPRTHIRASYRNFFNPAARWQFSGLRLATDEA